jgi:hypothetical protein
MEPACAQHSLPAGHTVHIDAPEAEKVPPSQGWHCPSSVALYIGANVSAGQLKGSLIPGSGQ